MYEGSVCLGCMATENLLDLFNMEDSLTNYAEMIRFCLNITVSAEDGHDSICKCCVGKLFDAIAFKSQIINSIATLTQDMAESRSENYTTIEPYSLKDVRKLHQITPEIISSVTSFNRWSLDGESDAECNVVKDTEPTQKQKRSVGRPRKYPKAELPYQISPCETSCRECGQEFHSNILLKNHYNQHFGRFPCGCCSKGFMTYAALMKHEATHQAGPFVCEHCNQEFKSINSMKSHKRLKHSNKPAFKCKWCEVRFPTMTRRLRHLYNEHGIDTRKYQCQYCHKVFRYSGERTKHERYVHKQERYSCPLCPFQSSKQGVYAHLANKHQVGEKQNECSVCEKRFLRRHALVQHVMTHTGYKRFSCKLCGKAFTQKVTLKYHINSHSRKGDFNGNPDSLIVIEENATGMLDEVKEESEDAESSFEVEDLVDWSLIED